MAISTQETAINSLTIQESLGGKGLIITRTKSFGFLVRSYVLRRELPPSAALLEQWRRANARKKNNHDRGWIRWQDGVSIRS